MCDFVMRRLFKIGVVPIYYKDDGSIDADLTMKDLKAYHDFYCCTAPDMFSPCIRVIHEDAKPVSEQFGEDSDED